ncbi:MAG TPA: hypothetical protein VFD87_05500 [Phototrophicaceae bacterium]|jgi:peptidoglycan/LPS O-acetylase OafA/YrhL|nr:hypothetical protein [Phototrophicaceae bacterium]
MFKIPNRFSVLSRAVAVHFALHHILIAELGVAALLAGGALAYRAYSKDRPILQKTAGLLLIVGFACLGVALYRIGGVPAVTAAGALP